MPGSSGGGSVVGANPSVVMPYSLARAFQRQQAYALDQNTYQNGEVQRSVLVETSRKRWVQQKHLTEAERSELLAFYLAQQGPLKEFIFYDVWETDPKFSYDESGAAVDGQYSVRFDGGFNEAGAVGFRSDVSLALIQVS